MFLDTENRETLRLLSSPEYLHGAVESCFENTGEHISESNKSRRLWRVDGVKGQCCLLVVSAELPDFSRLAAQYGPQGLQSSGQSKAYGPFLSRLVEGQNWHFRLRANPVRSVMEEQGSRGKVTAHVTPNQQKEWLLKRAAGHGFSLDSTRFEVVHSQWHRFDKRGGRQVSLRTATFEGVLSILDPDTFRTALTEGIGRAKAYGCGLMTLAPVPESQDA